MQKMTNENVHFKHYKRYIRCYNFIASKIGYLKSVASAELNLFLSQELGAISQTNWLGRLLGRFLYTSALDVCSPNRRL
jgi:hypothetical protein